MYIAQPLVLVHPTNDNNMSHYSAANVVLDPQFLALEPISVAYTNNLFG